MNIFSQKKKDWRKAEPLTPRKKKLQKKIKVKQEELWRQRKKILQNTSELEAKSKSLTLKQALACLVEHFPSDTVAFIESQTAMSRRSKQGYRWNQKNRMIALSIFFHSRKAYKILHSCSFYLPKALCYMIYERWICSLGSMNLC